MTGATETLQAALVAALMAHPPLADTITGIFDVPPARVAYPYAGIASAESRDFGHKTGSGREHRLTVSLWDDGGSVARLLRLMAEAETALAAMPRDLGGHRLVSLAFLNSRVARYPVGPMVGVIAYRARTLTGST